MRVRHPRAFYVPVIGAPLAVPLYSASLQSIVDTYQGRCDVLFASWLYPDGCSAIRLASRLGVPCVVKAHGSDVQRIAARPDIRPIVRALLPGAAAVVAPSQPLVRALVELGGSASHAFHVPNGVDRTVFHPRDRQRSRQQLGLSRDSRLVVFVGRLTREKGIAELLRAHDRLPSVTLALVGDGPMRAELDRAALAGGRLLAPGAQAPLEVAQWMAAADVVTLPSWSEGTPNVVLEAMASGRPVVATKVGGIPDVLPDGRAGILVPPRDDVSLASALARALDMKWSAEAISALAPGSWAESAATLERVLRDAVSRHQRTPHAA